MMIQALKERLRLERIAKYGPGSEKLTNQQLELLELEPGVSNLEVAAEGEREALPPTPDKKKRKHPGRQRLPADLPRVERVIACTSEQCVCGGCGQSTRVIGYEESEQLDVEPMKYFVLVTKREKRACKCCEERGVVAAPLPARIIEKSLASDHVIIDAIISKYGDHCPLYRQSVIFLRDAGIDISRATIDGWVMRVGDLLLPLVAVMGRELVSGSYIQADETPVDVQTRDGRPRNHHGYLWQYGTPGGAAIFEFRMGRGREGPLRFLGNFEGILQTDDYAAYDRVGGPKMVHALCWAHARRKFDEALKLNKQDLVSTRILVQMAKLFALDAQARDENMDHARRHALRMERAPSVFTELKAQIDAASRTALPSSPLGKACSYTLRLWDKLTRFLHYPELELSKAMVSYCTSLWGLSWAGVSSVC
jgi:transposase